MSSNLQERLDFIGIDKNDSLELKKATPLFLKILPGTLGKFYSHMKGWPQMASLFGDQDRMDYAKNQQISHWSKILSGEFNSEYENSVKKIGAIHNRIGLEPRWYIAGYSIIMCEIMNKLVNHAFCHPLSFITQRENFKRTSNAFLKSLMLDMDLSISTYLEAAKREKTELVDNISEGFDSTVGEIVTSLAANSSDASQGIESVAAASEELSNSIREISDQTQTSADIVRNASAIMSSTKNQVEKLNASVQEISKVADLISAIASQTNLLALNATIEAARAGESGKGFAVVANEVKTLANETASATQQILIKITQIQKETKTTVDNISIVAGQMSDIETRTVSISAAIEEQTVATNEISRNAGQATYATSSVATQADQLKGTIEIFLSKIKAGSKI